MAVATSSESRVGADGVAIRPFQVEIRQEQIDDLRRRINETRWPEQETVAGSVAGRAAGDDAEARRATGARSTTSGGSGRG